MEIFQYIHDYNELYKELNTLKKYNIIKKKKLTKRINEIETSLQSLSIFDFLDAIYNYINTTHSFDKNYDFEDEIIIFRENGFIAFSAYKYFIEYSVNTRILRIQNDNIAFFVDPDTNINNTRLIGVYNKAVVNIYNALIKILQI